jgi:hypothetical protein
MCPSAQTPGSLTSIDSLCTENDARCSSEGKVVAKGSIGNVDVKSKHFNSWHVPIALLPGREVEI